MTGERLKRVEAIFFRVVGLDAQDRARVLDAECAGDGPLRAEVESLLPFAAVPDSFLATPALARGALTRAAGDPAGESDGMVGRTVGAYRIQERIASGGR